MKTYPDEIVNRGAQWLAFCADMETGWDELEPHQIVSRDFVAGVADEPKEEAA
jgi:hypothetical protein